MSSVADPGELYLSLMKECLTNRIYGDVELRPVASRSRWKRWVIAAFESRGLRVLRPEPVKDDARLEGREWLPSAHTMIGMRRLDNLQQCIESVLSNEVPGDLVEAGVWRGGSGIFMRAVLKAHGSEDRRVWLADSFQGLPPPNPDQYPADAGDIHHTVPELAVTLEEVKANFARYDLLDDRVRFLPGWFRDTLPQAPIDRLAVI
ncbi:MAG: macrocin O-methyltransferase, partial [Actinobacteria bacterium]|nr:macrocin O-methyltransferase [Actinomycetota bacterium]